jgi:polyhydroxyalkanoate synthase
MTGHSLGGTLAAIFATLHPKRVRGLSLLEAPTKFGKDGGPLALAVARMPGRAISAVLPIVPGTFLDLVGVTASPWSFLTARWLDALSVLGYAQATMLHLRVDRWTLDELPMPGLFFEEVVEQLYREDLFLGRCLIVAGRRASPAALHMPLLAVLRPTSLVVPPSSVLPLLDAAPSHRKQLLRYAGDRGASLQHVGVLVGKTAHAQIWPAILRWFDQLP